MNCPNCEIEMKEVPYDFGNKEMTGYVCSKCGLELDPGEVSRMKEDEEVDAYIERQREARDAEEYDHDKKKRN